jgi:uncharacterized protein
VLGRSFDGYDAGVKKDLFLFAPGAGAPSTSAWMQSWKAGLSVLGDVVTLDYPYMREGRKMPDRLPVLVAAHEEALAAARPGHRRTILIGKSMGSRVGCHLSLTEKVHGLICLGYPLVSPSKARTVRSEVLESLRTPVLFVQGTRDPLCPLPLLEAVRARMKATSTLVIVDGGDHSLLMSGEADRRTGVDQGASDARVLSAIRAFVRSLGRGRL